MKHDHNQICTNEKEVFIGQQYQYKEEGMLAVVTILEDTSNEKGIGFKLRVDDPMNSPWNKGEEFTCWAASGHYGYSGMWRLWNKDEYVMVGA